MQASPQSIRKEIMHQFTDEDRLKSKKTRKERLDLAHYQHIGSLGIKKMKENLLKSYQKEVEIEQRIDKEETTAKEL